MRAWEVLYLTLCGIVSYCTMFGRRKGEGRLQSSEHLNETAHGVLFFGRAVVIRPCLRHPTVPSHTDVAKAYRRSNPTDVVRSTSSMRDALKSPLL